MHTSALLSPVSDCVGGNTCRDRKGDGAGERGARKAMLIVAAC